VRSGNGRFHRTVPNYNDIPVQWIQSVHGFLEKCREEGRSQITALEVANFIAHEFGYEQDRYLIGKPRTYFLVARYMDSISSEKGDLRLIEAGAENRWYWLHYKIRVLLAIPQI
jgi:hypothetical protein